MSNHSTLTTLLMQFQAASGRPLRVLHIGNIANNAYSNSKLLNQRGCDSDVICYDYYHAMGCPEWEELEASGQVVDEMMPDWRRVDLGGFERPRWFAQGPFDVCAEYLLAQRHGEQDVANELWRQMGKASRYRAPSLAGRRFVNAVDAKLKVALRRLQRLHRTGPAMDLSSLKARLIARAMNRRFPRVLAPIALIVAQAWLYVEAVATSRNHPFERVLTVLRRLPVRYGALGWVLYVGGIAVIVPAAAVIRLASIGVRRRPLADRRPAAVRPDMPAEPATPAQPEPVACEQSGREVEAVLRRFAEQFPRRADQMSAEDVAPFLPRVETWRRLLECYDVVIAYSTDPMWPMLAEHAPYVAFEHGTIRDIPWEDSARGRLCALSYAKASVVYVTNADSLGQARALGAGTIVHGFHGFEEARLRRRIDAARQAGPHPLLRATDGRAVFFAPARHHWREGFPSWRKGNDIVIRAAAQLAHAFPGRFRLVFIHWGAELPLSKQLIEELGIGSYVEWHEPMPKAELLRGYATASCVIDQFVLPCIGSVTLEAIAVGHCPVITRLDDAAMMQHYGATIPLFNAGTVEDVYRAMRTVMEEPDLAMAKASESRQWFDRYHSGTRLEESLAEAFTRCLPSLQSRHEASHAAV